MGICKSYGGGTVPKSLRIKDLGRANILEILANKREDLGQKILKKFVKPNMPYGTHNLALCLVSIRFIIAKLW